MTEIGQHVQDDGLIDQIIFRHQNSKGLGCVRGMRFLRRQSILLTMRRAVRRMFKACSEMEGAALADAAFKPDFPSQQCDQPGADRQPQARAAIVARYAAISLRKSVEDKMMFFPRYSNAGISNAEM